MRNILLFIGLTFFMTACNTTEETKETVTKTTFEKYGTPYGIPWQKDLDTAFLKAKEEKKLVIVMAVSQGCKWCEKMKKETLSNPKVAKRLENYILVMADRETPTEKSQLPPFNHVPIIFFMTHEKESLDNLRGFFDAEDFIEYLNDLEEE